MTEIRYEQRSYSRTGLDLPVEIHQGGSMWRQRLLNISLSGLATDQPDLWDAQYNEPFTLVIKLDGGIDLELYAYLQHVESDRLGFSMQHVDRENIEPLMDLLGKHMDIAALEEELARLEKGPQ